MSQPKISFLDFEGAGSPTLTKSGEFGSTVRESEDDDLAQQPSSASLVLEQSMQAPLYVGTGYQLLAKRYADPTGRERSYYFTGKLGTPFPSYHSNPEAFFPPRWTSVRGAKLPVENLTAPRIRLAPKELESRHLVLKAMALEAKKQQTRPKPKVLNLSHQQLGDPYQMKAAEVMLQLNDTVETLNLNDNDFDDLSSFPLDHVKRLYLDKNSITSFLQLPPLPNCVELVITNNFILGYAGLERERFPKLRKIYVDGNPLCTDLKHRSKILKCLPDLLLVDWFTRQHIEASQSASTKDINRGAEDDTLCC